MKNVISIVLNNFKNDSRVLKEGCSLKEAGYNVKVLALWDKQAGLLEYDEVSGLPVHRVKLLSKGWPKIGMVQIFKYMEFVFRATKECVNADILHCNDLDALLIGVISKLISRGKIKVVYDAHELETEMLPDLNYIVHNALIRLEKFCLRFTDVVITVSEGIASEYARKYGINKPALVENAPFWFKGKNKNLLRKRLGIPEDKKIFLYQGGLNTKRGIELLISACERLAEEDIVLVCMGYGILKEMIIEKSLNSNIYYHEAVPVDELLGYTAGADYGCIMYENSCLNYYYCMPNKIFEYTSVGLPVIVSNLYELSRAVKKYNIGVVVEKQSVEATVDAIKTIMQINRDELKVNALKFAKEHCWEVQEKVLLAEYAKLNN